MIARSLAEPSNFHHQVPCVIHKHFKNYITSIIGGLSLLANTWLWSVEFVSADTLNSECNS